MIRGLGRIVHLFFKVRPPGMPLSLFEVFVRTMFVLLGTLAIVLWMFDKFERVDSMLSQSRQYREQELEFQKEQAQQDLETQRLKDVQQQFEARLTQIREDHEMLKAKTDRIEANQIIVMNTLAAIVGAGKWFLVGIGGLILDKLGGFTVALMEHRRVVKQRQVVE